MSAETKTALDRALQAHVADECGGDELVTAYVIACATTSFSDPGEENRHSYYMDCPNNQPPHVSRGLSDIMSEWTSSTGLFDADDDDD